MKLTEEMKQKIDSWFESKTEEEVKEILKSCGIEPNQEAVDERPIGDVFEFEGHKLKVVKSKSCLCSKCFLYTNDRCSIWNTTITGFCDKDDRSDKNYVIFVEV